MSATDDAGRDAASNMTETIQPFHRAGESRPVRQRRPRVLPLMLLHFAVAGIVLLLAAAGLLVYLYTLHFTYAGIGWNLRISGAGAIYGADVQLLFAAAVLLAGMSLLQLIAFRTLAAGSADALAAARVAALILLLGFPLAVVAWGLEPDLPGVPISTAQTAVRVLAALAAFQAALALAYSIYLALPGSRRVIHRDLFARRRVTAWTWIVTLGLGLWLLALVAGGVVLALLTGVIELPVQNPAPGELVYATTFEGSVDSTEWDLYEGRDSAQIIPVERALSGADQRALRGQALVITHASPIPQEVIFSALDRKFKDMDLRVTARMIDGPDDNQYGVVFRYRDQDNYYAFFISADGYYSLVKRENGTLRDISTWGTSDAIAAGQAANRIRILAKGDTFSFFVNGEPMPLCLAGGNAFSMWNPLTGACQTSELVTTYRDPDFTQGGVALAAGSSVDLSAPVVIAFDDLTLVGPAPDTFTVEPDEGTSAP